MYQTASALVALAVFYCYRRRSRAAVLLLWPFFLLLGFLHVQPALQAPTDPGHILRQLASGREEVALTGILHECPGIEEERSRLLMAVETIHQAGSEERAATGLIRLTLKGFPPPALLPGDRFRARAVVSAPRGYGIPGVFDYPAFLKWQGIWVTGWVSSPALLMEVHAPAAVPLGERLRYAPERLRARLSLFLTERLEPPVRGVCRAILLGDRSEIDPDRLERFKATGTVHLLAISGLHMGLLALLTAGSLAWLLKRSTRLLLRLPVWKIAALFSLPPLIGYAFIAGFQAPVVRALIMSSVFLLAILADRQWNLRTNIAMAALLILIWQPTQLYLVSFQLSFAAVIGIALFLPQLRSRLLLAPEPAARFSMVWKWAGSGLAVSLAATAGTLPLLLYYFNRIPILGPAATLLLEPFLCFWTLPLGLISFLLLPFSPNLAGILLQAGAVGVRVADGLAAHLAALPATSLWLPTPTLWEVVLFYLLLIALACRGRLQGWQRVALGGMAVLTIVPSFPGWLPQQKETVRVTFLDVGQGSATLIHGPGRSSVLIDGGGYGSPGFDPGERLIAPFLWRQRILRLDGLVISHPHADHYNGLSFVIKRFRPRVLWINGQQGEPDYDRLLALAGSLGSEIRVPEEGEVLFAQGEARLLSLAGLHLPAGRSAADPNNHSLVLRLDCGGHGSFLLPGDIDAATEGRLVKEGRLHEASVVLAAHHGSAGSNSRAFMEAVSPRFLVVSTGPFHPGEPKQASLWRRKGICLLSTSDCGSVSFSVENAGLAAETFSPCSGMIRSL